MSRSHNSRKGSTNRHGKRHHICRDGTNCPYCMRNLTHATLRRKPKLED
jgi:hypothetical protein